MPAGPLGTGAWARLAGHVARPFYAAGIAVQNWSFDRGLGVERAGVPIISVGNLTAGGTGKTPVVVWLVRQLQHLGFWPGVALRGYRELPRPADLDPRATLVGRWSDEVDELLRALPGTPLVAQPDRLAGIRRVLGGGGRRPDCCILDDGFQHRRLARDFDIVLLDATRNPLEDRLLPLGWMRESLASLGRAHAEVLTRFNPADEEHQRLRARIGELRGRAPFTAVPIWGGLQGVPGVDLTPVSFLEGKRLVAACGIGNPAAFLRQLKAEAKIGGGKLEGSGPAGGGHQGSVTALFYPDHHPYPARSVREIVDAAQAQRAHAIVVTDKDWSKLRRLPAETWPCPVVRPLLTMRIDGGEVLMERVVGAIRKGGSPSGTTG